MRTRVIHLDDGQDREAASNARTGVLIGGPPALPSATQLLARTWHEIRRVVTGFATPGVAVVAVDTIRQRLAGSMCIAAKPGGINAGVVGRHGQCDLYLESDPALSLRHLVVVIDPMRDWGGPGGSDVRYRLLDLRTSTGFRDETDRRLEAITVEGPAFVFVGRYALYCFPTSGPTDADDWPEDPEAAVATLPERIYLDQRDAEPDRWKRGRVHANPWAEGSRVESGADSMVRSQMITRVTSSVGPARARVDVVDPDDPQLGILELRSRLGRDTVRVGLDGATRGMLFGRYSRCDQAGVTSLSLEKISRVHLLVLQVGSDLWAIDTASTNGVQAGGGGVRVHRLTSDDELVLADGAGAVRWQPVH